MTYYESEFATIEYDSDIDAVVGTLYEFTEGEEFREYMNAYIDALEAERTNKILADTSPFEGALRQEDQGWSAADWSPRAVEAGLEHMAMVMPESIVAEMSVESVVEQTDDPIDRGIFDDVDEAADWLAGK